MQSLEDEARESKVDNPPPWLKRVMFKFINGAWVSSVKCVSGEYFTPRDRKMLERELKLAWRKYQHEQLIANKKKG